MEAALILLTYALSSALVYSDGAFGIMYRIRNHELVKEFGVFDCFLCCSFWVAVLVSIPTGDILMFAYAWGGAVIVDKFFTWLFTK